MFAGSICILTKTLYMRRDSMKMKKWLSGMAFATLGHVTHGPTARVDRCEPASIMYQAEPRPPPTATPRNTARFSTPFLNRLKGCLSPPVRWPYFGAALGSPGLDDCGI